MARLLLIPILGLLLLSLLLIVSAAPPPRNPVRSALNPFPRTDNDSLVSVSTTDGANNTGASANTTDNADNTGASANITDNADNTGVSANITGTADGTLAGNVYVHYKDGTCAGPKIKAILEEMQYAVEMAQEAASDPRSGNYFSSFFAASLPPDMKYGTKPADVFRRIAELIKGDGPNTFTVTCDGNRRMCKNPNYVASMTDKGNGDRNMNFCDQFFTHPEIKSTKDRIGECSTISLREAHRTRAAMIIHETTHTRFVMNGNDNDKQALDYAYGIRACLELAGGVFNRGCTPYGQHDQKRGKPMCPDRGNPTLEGVCDEKLSAHNADSWAMVAAGKYFSSRCGRHVPISAVAMDDEPSSCPDYSDALAIDKDLTRPISGYAHFGDSYAAGMGTASTSGDSCRRGGNGYGKLFAEWLGEGTFYDLACSGDTTVGLDRQIDRWALENTGGHIISTLTMGGNDVLFSEIVRNCVITMGLDWPTSGEQYRKDCLATEDKARAMMEDSGPDGLGAKLMAGYKRILDTAESPVTSRPFRSIQLFVPGYVGFFNHDTDDCDFTSFYYWNPAWDPQQPCCKVYLTRELRRELNDLVNMLNDLIEDTIARTNSDRGTQQVHYVNMQPHFDGHRWCENNGDDYHEPDENIKSTYFFLSGWQDFSIGRSRRASAAEATNVSQIAEVTDFVENGGIQLPPAETCQEDLGTDPDPYAVFMCERSMNIAAAPNGTAAQSLELATAAIAEGDYESNDISWWLPTRQIKTFHPRSPGMALYRDAVIDAMDKAGLDDEWTGD